MTTTEICEIIFVVLPSTEVFIQKPQVQIFSSEKIMHNSTPKPAVRLVNEN